MIKLCVGNSPLKCIFNALYLEAQNKFIALLLVELLLLSEQNGVSERSELTLF